MQIEKACFGNDAWSKSNMKSELVAPHTTYVVAEQGDELIGYAGLSKLAASTSSDIQTIAVSDRYRGSGIGRAQQTASRRPRKALRWSASGPPPQQPTRRKTVA